MQIRLITSMIMTVPTFVSFIRVVNLDANYLAVIIFVYAGYFIYKKLKLKMKRIIIK